MHPDQAIFNYVASTLRQQLNRHKYAAMWDYIETVPFTPDGEYFVTARAGQTVIHPADSLDKMLRLLSIVNRCQVLICRDGNYTELAKKITDGRRTLVLGRGERTNGQWAFVGYGIINEVSGQYRQGDEGFSHWSEIRTRIVEDMKIYAPVGEKLSFLTNDVATCLGIEGFDHLHYKVMLREAGLRHVPGKGITEAA